MEGQKKVNIGNLSPQELVQIRKQLQEEIQMLTSSLQHFAFANKRY